MRAMLALLFLVAASPLFGQGWAPYNGKMYRVNSNGRMCSNPSCVMCDVLQKHYFASIKPKAQLGVAPAAKDVAQVLKEVELEWVPMPDRHVRMMMDMINPGPGMLVYDLGCGDGRVLKAALDRGCRAVGIELNPETARAARKNLAAYKRGWLVHELDATNVDLSTADIVTCYLYSNTLAKIKWNTLKDGAVVISYQHAIPGLRTTPILGPGCTFYVHEAP